MFTVEDIDDAHVGEVVQCENQVSILLSVALKVFLSGSPNSLGGRVPGKIPKT